MHRARYLVYCLIGAMVMAIVGCGAVDGDDHGGAVSPYSSWKSIQFYSDEDQCDASSHAVYITSYTPTTQYPGDKDNVNLTNALEVYYNKYPTLSDPGNALPEGEYTVCYQRDCGSGIKYTLDGTMYLSSSQEGHETTRYVYKVGKANGHAYQDGIPGVCSDHHHDPVSVDNASAYDLAGTFTGRDPDRTYTQYHNIMYLETDMTLTLEEWANGTMVEGKGNWEFDTTRSFFSFSIIGGGSFSGAITGDTNSFTLNGTWGNGSSGVLNFTRQ